MRSVVGVCAAAAADHDMHATHETAIIQLRAIDIFSAPAERTGRGAKLGNVRVVGIDLGERRIGVAISDATRTLARPVGVLLRPPADDDALRLLADEIRRLGAEEDGVESIVLGLPRRLDGTPHDMTLRVQAFAEQLGAASGMPVALQDERL